MFLNTNNICIFEGRLTADPEVSYINTNDGAIPKVSFTLAVDKNMNKQQKETAKANGQNTADFIKFNCIGKRAEYIQKYFTKGKPAKVVSGFKTYNYTAQDGTKKYGYNFEVVDISFTVSDKNATQSNGYDYGNANNTASSSYQGLNNNEWQAIDDDDIPF